MDCRALRLINGSLRLRLEHTEASINNNGFCIQCSCFMAKSHQARLKDREPVLSSSTIEKHQLGVVEDDIPKLEV